MLLQIIIVSTRQGRLGVPVARWFHEHASHFDGFQTELIDLAEVNLPLFDEPHHPRLANYQHEHTKQWSAMITRADAFVFVTPEYNFGAPPSLVNALDYLNREWAYKPAAFVSYGGVSGGTRSVQMAKSIMTGLRMVPIVEAVNIPFFTQLLDHATGELKTSDVQVKAADLLLKELHKWAVALKTMRQK
jgi:NAD(P)H-dependent FMN reductase